MRRHLLQLAFRLRPVPASLPSVPSSLAFPGHSVHPPGLPAPVLLASQPGAGGQGEQRSPPRSYGSEGWRMAWSRPGAHADGRRRPVEGRSCFGTRRHQTGWRGVGGPARHWQCLGGGVLSPGDVHPVIQHGQEGGPTQNCKFTPNLFWAHQCSLVGVYLTGGPRQLLFSRCGPEAARGGAAQEGPPGDICVTHAAPQADSHQKTRPVPMPRLVTNKDYIAFVKAVCLSCKFFAVSP